MKTRNELAHDYLCAMLANPHKTESGDAHLVRWALGTADAFIAAAGEQRQEQREQDAVWVLRKDSDWDVVLEDPSSAPNANLITYEKFPKETDGRLTKLLAGRERVRLRVYVEEVEG